MEEAILFRSMIESLSTKEFNTFSERLFNKFDPRDLLTNCISHLLIYQNRNAMNTQYSNNINNILIKIIQSRNDNKNERNSCNKTVVQSDIPPANIQVSISDVPYPLIANISSFLTFSQVFKFIRSNRHIYVSCKKNTNWITEITPIHWIMKYNKNNFGSNESRAVRLSRFNMVQKLRLSYFSFKMQWTTDTFVFKNIRALEFRWNSGANFEEWFEKYSDIFKTMKQLQYLHLNVTRLLDISHLLSLMTINETLKYLSFGGSHNFFRLSEDASMIIQQEIYNKFDFAKRMKCLQGLEMRDYLDWDDIIFFDALLSKISGQLQSYHIDCSNSTYGHFNSFWNNLQRNYQFPKLKEICIFLEKTSNEESFDFLTALQASLCKSDLIRFSISISLNGIPNFNEDNYSKFNKFIQNILSTNKRLQYLSIAGDDGTILDSLCNFIESQFIANGKNTIFESLFIHFPRWKSFLDDAGRKNIENLLFRLIAIINKTVSGNWRIKCLSPWNKKQKSDADEFDETNAIQCVERFENIKDLYYVSRTEIIMITMHSDKKKRDSFTINKPEAIFNGGTRVKWEMSCWSCSGDCYDF